MKAGKLVLVLDKERAPLSEGVVLAPEVVRESILEIVGCLGAFVVRSPNGLTNSALIFSALARRFQFGWRDLPNDHEVVEGDIVAVVGLDLHHNEPGDYSVVELANMKWHFQYFRAKRPIPLPGR